MKTKTIFSLFTFFFSSILAFGQSASKQDTYDGLVHHDPVSVTYHFYNDPDGKRVWHGKLSSNVIDKYAGDILTYHKYSYNLSANCENSLLHGPISAVYTYIESDKKNRYSLQGAFNHGKPDGLWNVTFPGQKFTATIKNDMIVGKFSVNYLTLGQDKGTFEGYFDDKGRINGLYTFKSDSYKFQNSIVVDHHTSSYDMPDHLKNLSIAYAKGTATIQDLESSGYALMRESTPIVKIISSMINTENILPRAILNMAQITLKQSSDYLYLKKVPYLTEKGFDWFIDYIYKSNEKIKFEQNEDGHLKAILRNKKLVTPYAPDYTTSPAELSYNDGLIYVYLTLDQAKKTQELIAAENARRQAELDAENLKRKAQNAELYAKFFELQKHMSESTTIFDILYTKKEFIKNDYDLHKSSYRKLLNSYTYTMDSYTDACLKLYPIVEYKYIPEIDTLAGNQDFNVLLFEVRSRNKNQGEGYTTYRIPVHYTVGHGMDFKKTFNSENIRIVRSLKDELYDSIKLLDKKTKDIESNISSADIVSAWQAYMSASQSNFRSKGVEQNLKNVQDALKLSDDCLAFIDKRDKLDNRFREVCYNIGAFKNLKKVLRNTYKSYDKSWTTDTEKNFLKLADLENLFEMVTSLQINGKITSLNDKLDKTQSYPFSKLTEMMTEYMDQ